MGTPAIVSTHNKGLKTFSMRCFGVPSSATDPITVALLVLISRCVSFLKFGTDISLAIGAVVHDQNHNDNDFKPASYCHAGWHCKRNL